jgi:hypothetical protein
MPTPVYTSPFTGTVVTPTDVSYYALSFSTDQELFWPSTVNGSQPPAARIIDCAASTSGLTITLPAANQGTVGADILFRNLGAFEFIVLDNTGAVSLTVPVGIAKYLYLADNTTQAGVWNNVTFGAGTSYADASSLYGNGLAAINGKLVTTQNTVTITSTPIINDASRAATFVWEAGAGNLNLPSYSGLTSGWFIGFRNNGTGALNINPVSPSTINTQLSITTNPGDSGFIFFDNSTNNFYTVGLTAPASASFTAATYDVDAVPGSTLNLASYAPIIQTYIAQSGTRTTTLAVTLPAITQIYILVNNTNQTGYDITFQNQGSSQPPLVLAAGAVYTVLSDGINLYPLTQSSTGIFYAANGTAGAPSYSFSNDTTTGMYLPGPAIVGIAANGNQLVSIDNSNVLSPLTTIQSRLYAYLINGGTF